MTSPLPVGPDWAFQAYEAVRHRLPAPRTADTSRSVNGLLDLCDEIDVFLLDAFGVLNVGEEAIPGAPACIAALRAAGKRVMIVSNAASYPRRHMLARNHGLGFDFLTSEVVTSRETLLDHLRDHTSIRWGLAAQEKYGLEEFESLDVHYLKSEPEAYDIAEGFLFFGSGDWSDEHQSLLETSLRKNPRPVYIGNPDIVAPRVDGLSREPGLYAHQLADQTGVEPVFFGKPFGNIYETARKKLPETIDPARVLMVGDTLHTDILGGAHAGFKTALVTEHGALKGMDFNDAIKTSGIVPDFIMPCIG